MDPSIIALVILIILLLVVSIAGMAMMQASNKKKERTLAVIKGTTSSETKVDEKDLQNKRRAEIAKKLKEAEDEEAGGDKKKKSTPISLLLVQAGLSITPNQYWMYSIVLAMFTLIITSVMGMNPVAIIMLGITALLGVPRFVVRHITKRRQKKFLEEFSDALEAMVRLLKAGMPVSEAIAMAAKEYEGPVGEEMSRIYDAQKIGVSLPDAATEAARRMPLTEMQMFATGVTIQAQTGASLSEVFLNLAGVIRARFRLKRKVAALSAEAKASAMIIGCLPILVGSGLYFINKEYIMVLFTTTVGNVLLGFGIIWMGIGIFIMKAMINFKV
jgi:tight adherence protein B